MPPHVPAESLAIRRGPGFGPANGLADQAKRLAGKIPVHGSRAAHRRSLRVSGSRRHLSREGNDCLGRSEDDHRIRTGYPGRREGEARRLLLHEDFIMSLFPVHGGMRQYGRDWDSLEKWARSEPHRQWWTNFLKD